MIEPLKERRLFIYKVKPFYLNYPTSEGMDAMMRWMNEMAQDETFEIVNSVAVSDDRVLITYRTCQLRKM